MREELEIGNWKFARGYTLIELMIVVGIVGILLSLITINLSRTQSKTSVASVTSEVVAAMKEQQVKAMVGDTEGTASSSRYGIRFETNSYVLFRGSSYSASDPSNVIVVTDPTIQFTNILFPDSTIIFEKISGEIVGYSSGQDAFTIRHTESNDQNVVELNKLGVVNQVQ